MRPLAFLVSASWLFVACARSDPGRAQIIANSLDVSVCCDPAATPIKVGAFRIQIFEGQLAHLDESTVTTLFTTSFATDGGAVGRQHGPPSPVRLSLASGQPLVMGSNNIEVFVDSCDFARVTVNYLAEVLGRRKDDRSLEVIGIGRTFTVTNTCPPAEVAPLPQKLLEAVLGRPVSTSDFARLPLAAPVGVPTFNRDPRIPAQVPIYPFTEVFQTGAVVVELDAQQLADAFTGPDPTFPLGVGDAGFTIQAVSPLPMAPGRYLFAWQCVEQNVPLEHPMLALRLAFLADRDANSANNFQNLPPFEKEQFDDTDTWYVANFDPFGGWSVSAVDAQQFPPNPMDSAVRVIIDRQGQYFVIPMAELDDAEQILVRYATLAHENDYGKTRPWSADATPPVDEPLIRVSTAGTGL
jgi:hypothetical protein